MKQSSLERRIARHLPAVITLANSDRLPVYNAAQGAIPGQIYELGNDSRFSEAMFSEPLTTFATGFKDPNDIEATLEFFAPKVLVPGRLFEWKKWANSEEFYSESDDVRAIGGDFKRVEYTGSDQTGKTFNKGLMMEIDLDQVVQQPGWENRYVAKLIRRLLRNELRRALTLVSAAATNTGKTWDVNADPDQDVISELVTAADASGIPINRIGYGHTAWSKRSLALRGNANASKFTTAGFNKEQLAGLLNVDEVLVSRERYQTAAATKSQIVGNLVLMFCAAAGQDIEDPSNIKRFVSPPPNLGVDADNKVMARPAGGLDLNVYLQQVSPKIVRIFVEHYSNLIMTSTLGIRQFTVS
jgi:hypothetical protein